MVAHSCQLPKFWTHIRHWFGATTTQGNVSTMDVVSGAITHSCSITVRLAAHVNHIWWDHKRWIRWEIFQMNWFDLKRLIFSISMAIFTKVLLLQAGKMRKGQEKHLNNRSDSEKEEGGWARGEGGVAPVGLKAPPTNVTAEVWAASARRPDQIELSYCCHCWSVDDNIDFKGSQKSWNGGEAKKRESEGGKARQSRASQVCASWHLGNIWSS